MEQLELFEFIQPWNMDMKKIEDSLDKVRRKLFAENNELKESVNLIMDLVESLSDKIDNIQNEKKCLN